MARLGFAEIASLQANHLQAAEPARALQADQHPLDVVEFDIVACQPRNMMGQPVVISHVIIHVIPFRQVLDHPGGGFNGRGLAAGRHQFSCPEI